MHDNRNDMMHDCMVQWPHCTPGVDCGRPAAAIIYFVSFFLLSSVLLMNLFVVVILEHFTQVHFAEDFNIRMEELIKYAW